jgi:hypothetical protein
MIKNFQNVDMPMAVYLQKKEETGLNFFQECIAKTNQFSAKYVLEKMLEWHQEHINTLKIDIQLVRDNLAGIEDLAEIEHKFSIQDLCEEFDLSTLTFVEAIKLAIRIAEKDVAFYQRIVEGNLKSVSREALKRILSEKSNYITFLRTEHTRLSYK